MPRVKRGTTKNKRKKALLQHAKGFRWGRKSKYKLAKDALRHAWTYAYRDRKAKKRTFRQLWELQINEQARKQGINYSRLIHGLKLKKIEIDRKVLAELANEHPEIFKKIIEEVKA